MPIRIKRSLVSLFLTTLVLSSALADEAWVIDSPSLWVESVTAHVGVDNDDSVDTWSDWQAVKETYDYTPGFAKQVKKASASLDLSSLPAGYDFQFEVQLTDTTENASKPMIDKMTMEF